MVFIAKKSKIKILYRNTKINKAGLYPPEKEELDTTTKIIID